jgi:ataxia telangiectasia mutated family protein
MEQVLKLVNALLQSTTATRQRRLRIRTYNVIPLTPCVGLVEWVPGTLPLLCKDH